MYRGTLNTLICFLFLLASIKSQTISCQNSKINQVPIYNSLENLRSDTFDILKYKINLEIGNTTNQQISGNTQIIFAPKINNRIFIRFDLLKLIVDSIKENNSTLSYNYNDTVLKINFISLKNITDTSMITIYYHGHPQIDATNWGGFYFDNTQSAQYAYNLGVGFGAKPHNYGRVWFPCFDNFVERSKYEFIICSDTLRKAYCNGQLISDIITNNKRKRNWILNDQIPTYLACVALANYTQVNWNINTLSGNKPIILAAVASDTSAMKAGFINLKNCIHGFENYFGPYKWNRFGYALVPFNSGAMEHATNIAYPRSVIGNLSYEADLMAHELSHHWWGNLITCETQEDMWINEGMATFSSYMFTEWQYGKNAYLNKVKNEHDKLLHFLHLSEGGFRAISGVPHNLTYGDHVYKKGADVAHTLRGYMGDSAFFDATKYTMINYNNKSINSVEFKNSLQTASGQNLNNFFTNWVFSGGWPHFSIDSLKYVASSLSSFNAIVSLKQKLFGCNTLYTNVPLEISFFKSDWSRVVKKVLLSGAGNTFTINIPFMPIYAALNYDSKINDASSHEVKTIKNIGNVSWNLGKLFMQVQNKGQDSSLIRVIHNYVKPDPFISNPINHILSNQRYWKIEGILSSGFVSKAKFYYDGNKTLGGTFSYLDTMLTKVNGDSIALYYRKSAKENWSWLNNATKFISGIKTGFIEIDSLKLGEYSFGTIGDTAALSINKNSFQKIEVTVYPNPSKNTVVIEFKEKPSLNLQYIISDLSGKKIISSYLSYKKNEINIDFLLSGAYVIEIKNKEKRIYTQKIIKE